MDRRVARGEPARRPASGVRLELLLGGGSLLHRVSRELGTVLERRLAPFGVTVQQATLLMWVARERLSPNQVAPLLGTDTAGVTRLLDRLEGKGLVRRRRHPSDRRSVVIELTREGRALVPRLPPVFGRVSGQLLAGFSEKEMLQLTALLQRMLRNLRDDEGGA
ncbi:transcriptional regulator, MarR family [Rubrobacter xylanophilus DSM 9941]|uniref:Transcriptional regulator, MarR family n=1 Tax=Rubrobacter xylanophilus (strain DSM 9941 / JCM 11954 / NBRC 16129 / PRD-1) TaxID=266117 RepID=Q1AWI0_RUBXD|nr:transcriptional regulator, MarR family [Rubrobacter xylanophilus DSM 9941]